MSLKLPPPLPPMTTLLGAIDTAGRDTAAQARDLTVAAVRRTMPARSGRARKAQRGAVRRARTGYTIEVSPSSRVRYPNGVTAKQVTRWVDQGTGLFGPKGRPIRPRRAHVFRLPNGHAATEVTGQRAQHIYRRAQTSTEAAVTRILIRGAQAGARAAERALGGATR